MVMLLFWIAILGFFLIVPAIVARTICRMLGVRDTGLRIGCYCLTVWVLWQHFQTPPERVAAERSGLFQAAPVDPAPPFAAAR